MKGQVNQQNRKATGSLAVRDLSGLVSSKDIISTENLVTLFVVVSKHSKLEWQSSYEKFCEFVVSQGDTRNQLCLQYISDYLLMYTQYDKMCWSQLNPDRPAGTQVVKSSCRRQ